MYRNQLTRRSVLQGAGASLLTAGVAANLSSLAGAQETAKPAIPQPGDANRAERMRW